MRRREADHRSGLLIASINGQPAHLHWMARFLQDAGFQAAPLGFNLRRLLLPPTQAPSPRRCNKCLREIRFSGLLADWIRALAGQVVVAFETAYAQLACVHDNASLVGRTVERVEARGKWLLMFFSRRPDSRHPHADEWHLAHLPPGERWRRGRSHMRIVISNGRI